MTEAPVARVLVVDDERIILDLVGMMLRRLQCDVVSVNSGDEAIRALLKHDRMDVAIVDHVMPGLNGLQTCKALREIQSDLELIVSSGYPEANVRCGWDGPDFRFLAKPYQLAGLRAMLESCGVL